MPCLPQHATYQHGIIMVITYASITAYPCSMYVAQRTHIPTATLARTYMVPTARLQTKNAVPSGHVGGDNARFSMCEIRQRQVW